MTVIARFRLSLVWVGLCFVSIHLAAFGLESTPARDTFLKMIERPRVDPKVEVGEAVELDGYKSSTFSFDTEPGERVPGVAMYPATPNGKMPCVIVMHGTGNSKESKQVAAFMKSLALKGCMAVAIDARFHGERAKPLAGTEKYNQAILSKFKGESKSFPFFWDTVYDAMRLIDILCSRDEIDSSRIGVIGYSKGGIETYFLAAVDPRVSVAVPCIGVQSFKWGLENDAWHNRVNTVKTAFLGAAKVAGVEKPDAAFAKTFFDKVVPGIYGEYDGPEMLPLIAPRALLMINGDSDGNTPLPGVTICAEKAKAAYAKLNAADKFKQIIEPKTGHKVTDEATQEALDFFAKHLGF
ncbi:MAG: acetylxylan esterase [Planctomycetota bacterium]